MGGREGRGVAIADGEIKENCLDLVMEDNMEKNNNCFIGPEQTNIVSEPWFIWMLVGTIGGTLWLALCVFTIWLCRRRRRNKKKKMSQNGMYSAVPVHKSDESTRGGNVLTREDVMYSQKDGNIHTAYGGLQSDLASLLDCGHKDGMDGSQVYSSATSMPQMKTFYQRPGQPPSSSVAPYATTTLINKGGNSLTRPGPNSVGDSGFRPINHAYVHSSASGSGDSCQKPDMRSSDSNTDNSRPNTGHYSYAAGCPHDHCEGLVSPGSDSGSLTTDENGMPSKRNKYSKIGGCSSCGQGKPPMVNWAELLPPPPEHPPHAEGAPTGDSSGGDCSLHRHNANNMAETRFMDNRSPMSPVSKISACSCPVPHDRMVPHLRANIPYSELDYPTHSCPPVSRYHGDMSGHPEGSSGSGGSNYNSDRPYSPKPLNTARPQASDILMHRCQSPRSCHNCGSSLSQPQGSLQPSSSSSSSSYNTHVHHHHPLQPETFVTLSQRPPCINDITDQRVGMYPPMGAYPQGGANGLATSFTQTAAGQCPFNPNYPYPPAALHGYRIPPMELSDQRNSSDLEQLQGRMYPVHDGPHVDRACQSSLPSLAGQCLQGGFRRVDSPTSEGVPDYAGESDMDVHRATDCHTPDSSVNGDGGSISAGSMLTGWPSQTDSDDISHDESDHCVQHQSDDQTSSTDSSFLADTDFASAVARAAELSGLTVVGTTVTDPKNSNTKKYRKHRAPPRAQSPYSTDSNMSAAVVHRPYPKSERKKQLQDQARKYGQRKESSMQEMEIIEAEVDLALTSYYPPYYPTLPLYPNNNPARPSDCAAGFRLPMLLSGQDKDMFGCPSVSVAHPSSIPSRLPNSSSSFVNTDVHYVDNLTIHE
ncbi:hypothetical protein Btru_046533 [Bulinus truncatus]|nr:hypothetical protein Btru_046533 [Bulinus truncatus]